MIKLPTSRALHMDTLSISGEQVPLVVKHNPQAHRFIVRVDMITGAVHVTTPSKRNIKRAVAFAHSHAGWIAEQRKHVDPAEPFCDGATLPIRGVRHVIRHIACTRRAVHQHTPEAGGYEELRIGGEAAFLPRRVKDWLRREVKSDLNERVLHHATKLGVRPARITVRDQSSRWGSCSSTRALSFSWRLILAPREVLDYVAAHEVAHLVHMNHEPAFWRVVGSLAPDYRATMRWLESKGPTLHKYGNEPFSGK